MEELNTNQSTIYQYHKGNWVLYTSDKALAEKLRTWKTTVRFIPQYRVDELGFGRMFSLLFLSCERPFPRLEREWYIHFNGRYKRKYARKAGIKLQNRTMTPAQKMARKVNFEKLVRQPLKRGQNMRKKAL